MTAVTEDKDDFEEVLAELPTRNESANLLDSLKERDGIHVINNCRLNKSKRS